MPNRKFLAWCPDHDRGSESGEIITMPSKAGGAINVAELYTQSLYADFSCFSFFRVHVAQVMENNELGPVKKFKVEVVVAPEFLAKEIK